jgi:hypothetical protein
MATNEDYYFPIDNWFKDKSDISIGNTFFSFSYGRYFIITKVYKDNLWRRTLEAFGFDVRINEVRAKKLKEKPLNINKLIESFA